MEGNTMMISHLSDDELLRYCRTQTLDDLSDELASRMEDLLDLLDELDHNLRRLAEKYHIDEDDLWYCDGPPITPPPGTDPPPPPQQLHNYQ